MTAFDEVVARYRSKGLLIHSNLLLLLLVGGADVSLIARCKRTKQFDLNDYELLRDFVFQFKKVATTPHVLTEVSNLAGQLKGEYRDLFYSHMAQSIEVLDEQYIASHF